jgi:hypothetical protein
MLYMNGNGILKDNNWQKAMLLQSLYSVDHFTTSLLVLQAVW